MRTLFITRDGPGLTYLESLFVPIFQRLGAAGFPFDVIQFRWGPREAEDAARRACEEAGIGYTAAPIWRRPAGAGPLAAAVAGRYHVRRAIKRFGSDVVMPRGSLAALSVPGGRNGPLLPMIYDSDGFDIDERVDFTGLSSSSLVYRLLRDIESQAVRSAERVVVRTASAREVLIARAGPPVERDRFQIVTNGRDEEVFHPFSASERASLRSSLDVPEEAPLIVYVGTIGNRQRTDRVGSLALALRQLRPDTRLLVISGSPEEARAALLAQVPELESFTTIMRLPPGEVPRYLAAADVGVAPVHKSFSTQGISPLKTAEYLLCGVPVVGTAGIGSNDLAIGEGVFFDESLGLDAAARWISDEVLPGRDGYRERARAVGKTHFSLLRSVEDYLRPLEHVRDTLRQSGGARLSNSSKAAGLPPAAA
jgi:glycosyltransferase involved in cell wall biosynthesis